MDIETIRNFVRWLETASYEEIEKRNSEIEKAKSIVTTREGKSDLRLACRLIDEEVLARINLGEFTQKS